MTTITLLRRTHTPAATTLLPFLTHLHPFTTTPQPTPTPTPIPTPNLSCRTQTPLEKQFETWTTHLKPGFTPSDVNQALNSRTDPDLAYDIFRWTAQHRNYKHNQTTYLTMIHLSLSGHRHCIASSLLDDILAGTFPPTTPFYNSLLRFCCSHPCLFTRAFDLYKRMIKPVTTNQDLVPCCKPDLDTYTMLFTVLLRKFGKINVGYVYLNSVRSLTRQMKQFGIVPDVRVEYDD